MSIVAGQQAVASDFISTSNDSAGYVAKTNAQGHLDPSFIPGMFGDGSDGALVFDGSTTILGMVPVGNVYTMTRDIFATTIVVNTSITVITANWRIFCTISIGGAGTIKQDGNAGTAGSYNSLPVAGGAAITGYFTTPAGGAGATGQGTGNPATVAGQNPTPKSSAGASGGAGYAGSSGASGGDNTLYSRFYAFMHGIIWGEDKLSPSPFRIISGAGAGGGGNGTNGTASGSGGAGGSAGGVVWIVAQLWQGTFTIRAQGGAGGAGGAGGGSGGSSNDQGGGGGGGGDGGFSFIAYAVKTWTGSYSLTGGSGGAAGTGSTGKNGTAGSNGATGQSLEVNLASF